MILGQFLDYISDAFSPPFSLFFAAFSKISGKNLVGELSVWELSVGGNFRRGNVRISATSLFLIESLPKNMLRFSWNR